MNNADVLKILNKVGEDFCWQMGKVGANYENGYMKAIRDCKAPFYKDDSSQVGKMEHIGEVNGMVLNADKKQMIRESIISECNEETCYDCHFYEPNDKTDDEYSCAIRDKNGNIPYYQQWDMESALGTKDHFPETTKKVVTNADRIRNMSDEELEAFIQSPCSIIRPDRKGCRFLCDECIAEWLKEKVE